MWTKNVPYILICRWAHHAWENKGENWKVKGPNVISLFYTKNTDVPPFPYSKYSPVVLFLSNMLLAPFSEKGGKEGEIQIRFFSSLNIMHTLENWPLKLFLFQTKIRSVHGLKNLEKSLQVPSSKSWPEHRYYIYLIYNVHKVLFGATTTEKNFLLVLVSAHNFLFSSMTMIMAGIANQVGSEKCQRVSENFFAGMWYLDDDIVEHNLHIF